MNDSNRRRFLQTAGASMAATLSATTGCTDLFAGRSGYDAGDAGYLSLVPNEGWRETIENPLPFGNVRKIGYQDIPAYDSIYYSLPNRSPIERAGVFADPEVVSDFVFVQGQPTIRVGRVQPDADPTEDGEVFDSESDPMEVEGYLVSADRGGIWVVGPDVLMYLRTDFPVEEMAVDSTKDLERQAARHLANRPSSFSTETQRNEQIRRIAESVGSPTRAKIDTNPLLRADTIATGSGFDIGTETTEMRSVSLFEQEQDPATVLSELRESETFGIDSYDDVEASQHGREVWIEGTTNTHHVDFLKPGIPKPEASFEGSYESGWHELTVRHDAGWSVPADRLRLFEYTAPHRSVGDPTDTQFADGYDVVEPGDSVTLSPPDKIDTVRLKWNRATDDDEPSWIEIRRFRLD